MEPNRLCFPGADAHPSGHGCGTRPVRRQQHSGRRDARWRYGGAVAAVVGLAVLSLSACASSHRQPEATESRVRPGSNRIGPFTPEFEPSLSAVPVDEALLNKIQTAMEAPGAANRFSKGLGPPAVAHALARALGALPELRNVPTQGALAWLLATAASDSLRDGNAALQLARELCVASGWQNPQLLAILAAAYAESGAFAYAVKWQTEALANPAYLAAFGPVASRRLALYERQKAFRDYDLSLAYITVLIEGSPASGWLYEERANVWYYGKHRPDKAIADLRRAISLGDKPDEAVNVTGAFNGLGWILSTSPDATLRDGKEAIIHAKRACDLTQWTDPFCLGTYAAACAELGMFEEAVFWQEKAMKHPEYSSEFGDEAKHALNAYRSGLSYRTRIEEE